MQFKWVPVNRVLTIKRKYLEVLARSRVDTFATREVTPTPMANQDGFVLEANTVQVAPSPSAMTRPAARPQLADPRSERVLMDYLALCRRLRQECRVAGNGPASLTNQTMEYQRLITWTNEAWMEIQRANPTWRFLRASWLPDRAGPVQPLGHRLQPDGLRKLGAGLRKRRHVPQLRQPRGDHQHRQPGCDWPGGHNLTTSDTVVFGTTGALPTGLTAGTRYYVVSPTTDGFSVATTANRTAINTSGTQSGTHTVSSSNTTNFVGLLSETDMADGLRPVAQLLPVRRDPNHLFPPGDGCRGTE